MSPLVNKAVNSIETLDLYLIKKKLMSSYTEGGKSWSQSEADFAEKWYKRFLILLAKYPNHNFVPSKTVDEIWHQHILDTKKYAKDCLEIFGEFLHHDPSYEVEEKTHLENAFEETNRFYLIEFGETFFSHSLVKKMDLELASGCEAANSNPNRMVASSCEAANSNPNRMVTSG